MRASLGLWLLVLGLAAEAGTVKVMVLNSGEQAAGKDVPDWIVKEMAEQGGQNPQANTGWVELTGEFSEVYSSMQGGRLIKARAQERNGQFAVSLIGFKITPPRGPVMLKPGGREVLKLTDYPGAGNVFLAIAAEADDAEVKRLRQYYPHGFNFVDAIRADGKVLWASKHVVAGKVVANERVLESVAAFQAALTAEQPDKRTAFEVHLRAVKFPGAYERADAVLKWLREQGYTNAGPISN